MAVGIFLIMGFGGLLVWVPPMLLIAAEIWAVSDTRLRVWPLPAAIAVAVAVAVAYGLVRPEGFSAWVGGGLLWLVPLPHFLLRSWLLRGGRRRQA